MQEIVRRDNLIKWKKLATKWKISKLWIWNLKIEGKKLSMWKSIKNIGRKIVKDWVRKWWSYNKFIETLDWNKSTKVRK